MKKSLRGVFVIMVLIITINSAELFATRHVNSISIGSQLGNSIEGTSGVVSYVVTIGSNGSNNTNVTVILSGSIPNGVSASFSFDTYNVSGNVVTLTSNSGSIILHIHSDGSLGAGTYSGMTLTFVEDNFESSSFAYLVDAPTPVELTSFAGTVEGNLVSLKWATATEVNNYGFEIERSLSSSSTNWQKIGFVNGSGNSNSPKEYSYIDNNPKSGSYSYRLKQIDNDGSYDYSNIVEIKIGLPTNLELKQNYPNPFNPSTTISFTIPNSGDVSLKIYNALGEEIATLLNGYMEMGVYNINFQAENLPSGFYVYQLKTGEVSLTKKMLFLK